MLEAQCPRGERGLVVDRLFTREPESESSRTLQAQPGLMTFTGRGRCGREKDGRTSTVTGRPSRGCCARNGITARPWEDEVVCRDGEYRTVQWTRIPLLTNQQVRYRIYCHRSQAWSATCKRSREAGACLRLPSRKGRRPGGRIVGRHGSIPSGSSREQWAWSAGRRGARTVRGRAIHRRWAQWVTT